MTQSDRSMTGRREAIVRLGFGNNRRPTVSLARPGSDRAETRGGGGGRVEGDERGGRQTLGADPSHSLLGGYLLIVLAP